jgi:hypothetical protein
MADTNWQDVGAAADLAARPLTEITLGRAKLALSHRNGIFGVNWTALVQSTSRSSFATNGAWK